MSQSVQIQCPECGAEFPLSDAITAQLQGKLEQQLRSTHQAQLQQQIKQAEQRAEQAFTLKLQDLSNQLQEQEQKIRQTQAAELALRKEKRELEARQQELDLELQRRLDTERRTLEIQLLERFSLEHDLKLKEKEKQINDLREALSDAKRKSEQGSQEMQGEVLELDIESLLRHQFPFDQIKPVPKGTRGADLVQEVVEASLDVVCGAIIWEIKNTKHWSASWLQKLKDDQRACGANIAVLVSVALPDDIKGFGLVEGVWVSDLRSYSALALVLRQQLVQLAYARSAQSGKQEKMELMYQYLVGDEFRQRVEGIVEAFQQMKDQLERERRAFNKQWQEREKLLERVILNTSGLYGDIRGIAGSGVQPVASLELDNDFLLDSPEH